MEQVNFNVLKNKTSSRYVDNEEEYLENPQVLNLFQLKPRVEHPTKLKGQKMEIVRSDLTIIFYCTKVHQKCEDLLVHCSFNTKEKKCSDLFTMIKTSEGFCCAFNYAGTIDDAYSKFDEDFEYYDGDADDDEFSSRIIANSKSGR
ncbi:hypothetical protein evm_014902 [Chilo suppressalis]|nr:hypothetical protein evm_014902 [Chilo suppressalis]